MITKETKEVVLDFALGKEENLKIALLVSSIYDDLRRKIISDFVEALEKELKSSLDDEWVVDFSYFENPLNKCVGFSISKRSWEKKYEIGIEAQRSGPGEFLIGVWKKQDAKQLDGLKSLLDEKIGYGKSNQGWMWYRPVDEHYKNWDDREVLFEMWFQRGSVVEYFKNQILMIKDLAASYIDKAIT